MTQTKNQRKRRRKRLLQSLGKSEQVPRGSITVKMVREHFNKESSNVKSPQ